MIYLYHILRASIKCLLIQVGLARMNEPVPAESFSLLEGLASFAL